jgi:hypothetical protein
VSGPFYNASIIDKEVFVKLFLSSSFEVRVFGSLEGCVAKKKLICSVKTFA